MSRPRMSQWYRARRRGDKWRHWRRCNFPQPSAKQRGFLLARLADWWVTPRQAAEAAGLLGPIPPKYAGLFR